MTPGERFEKALAYASRLHATQRRKGTDIPYVAHLLAVAALALEHGADEDTAIAALLHDAIEDQGGESTRLAIAGQFGERVAALVVACTDADTTPKPPWRARKEVYIAHLRVADPAARLISASDKLHNARSLVADYRVQGEGLWARFTGGRDGTLWYYRSIVDTLTEVGLQPPTLLAELTRTVAELERLARDGV